MKRNLKITTVVLLTITVAILCAAILIIMINHSEREPQLSSTNSDIFSVSDEVVSEENTTQDSSDLTISSNSQPTTSSKPSKAPSNSNQSSSYNNSVGITITGTGESNIRHPISGLPVKQPADPETGISWDGVSPIIYTYPDGTTGTEKKEGATYEYLPGMYNTIIVIRDDGGRESNSTCTNCGRKVGVRRGECWHYNYSRYCNDCGVLVSEMICHYCPSDSDNKHQYCSYCGKISGWGANGTCLRYWASGDYECVSCGEIFPANVCHTCTKGCRYCGKTMGNGINGTCYRDYFGDSNCPSCGISVPINTCHSCG